MAITRETWTDDDGSGTTGSIINNAELQLVQDVIESVAGDNKVLGGDPNDTIVQTSYPSGAGFDKLHRGTSVFAIDSALLHGSYRLEGVGVVASGTTLTVALMNLSDGTPDTPVASFTITSTTGARGESGTISFAAGGASKTYGVKVKVDTGEGFVWGLAIFRAGA